MRTMEMTQEAANCWHLGGCPKQALWRLLEAFHGLDNLGKDPSLMWDLRRQRFDWLRCFRPQASKLEQELAAMETLFQHHQYLPAADLWRCRAVLARGRGNHAEALHWLERAWYRHDGRGLTRSILAHNAGCAALELEDLHTAHVWLTQLHSCKESREDAQAGEADLATRVSLWEGDHLALQRQAKLLHPHAHPFEQSIWWRRTAALGVRVLLLDSTLGDPQKPDHPARYQLCHPPVVEWEADERFHRALLVVDYRLACLRFSLGLSPAEDLFYRQLPFSRGGLHSRISHTAIQVRIGRVYVALGRASRVASWLDAAYGCQWRQDLIKGREARLRNLQQLSARL